MPEKTSANVDTERSLQVTFLVERGTVTAETEVGFELGILLSVRIWKGDKELVFLPLSVCLLFGQLISRITQDY